MNYDLEQRVRSDLQPGEKMLWTGQPAQGLRLRGSDIVAVPFSLLWAGGVFRVASSAFEQASPAMIVFIPFVAVGFYILLGRFVVDAMLRARTYYAVTSQRVIILSGFWTREVRSIQLRTLREISLREGSGTRGTIEFGPTNALLGWSRGFNWAGGNRYQPPGFDLIEEPRQIYNLIRKAQQDLTAAE